MRLGWPECVLSCIGLLTVGVLVHLLIPRNQPLDPVFEGHPLSFWAAQLGGPNSPSAEAAVRQIGRRGVPLLLSRVFDQDEVRAGPVAALKLLGIEALPDLLEAFKSPNDSVRLAAIRQVNQLQPRMRDRAPGCLPAVTALLKDRCPDVRLSALYLLARNHALPCETVRALIDFLEECDVEAGESKGPVELALDALKNNASRACQAKPALTRLLRNPDLSIRKEAAVALWMISRDLDCVLPTLTDMLREINPITRQFGAFGLRRINRDVELDPQLVAEVFQVLSANHVAPACGTSLAEPTECDAGTP